MRLEQRLEAYRPTQAVQKDRIYTIVNLESLSATSLYTGEPCGRIMPIRDTIREDSHVPYGDHLNYEVWLELKGKKKGRRVLLSNTHIETNDDSK